MYDQAKGRVYKVIFKRLREIESQMSLNLPDTELVHVNAAADIALVNAHDEEFL
jgi:thiamine biosynthesis lipoprotein ApbE